MISEDGVLICPRCGSEWTHHRGVTVWDRDNEDSVTGRCVSIGQPMAVVTGGMVGNPSPRRGGLAVHVECEQCAHVSMLCISQHKGQTLFSWLSEA